VVRTGPQTARATDSASPNRLPRLTPHDLSAGANVKAVQRMLGHASAAMRLVVAANPEG